MINALDDSTDYAVAIPSYSIKFTRFALTSQFFNLQFRYDFTFHAVRVILKSISRRFEKFLHVTPCRLTKL
jgi:hypothetical protein